MTDQYTKDKRYRITHYIEKDFASYFESDTRWCWEVRDTKTNKIVTLFTESDFENASGRQESGAKDVRFSDDEQYVIAENYDGTIQKVPIRLKLKPKPKDILNKQKTCTITSEYVLMNDGSVARVWYVQYVDGKLVEGFNEKDKDGKKTGTKQVSFSKDGTRLLVVNHDGTEQTIELETDKKT